MDRRINLLQKLYALHSRLIDIYHNSSADHVLFASFCDTFVAFVDMLNPRANTRHFELLFRPSADLTKKEELSAHLLAASDYAAELTGRIEADPAIVIDNEIVALLFDYAKLLRATANGYSLPVGSFSGSRNTKVSAYSSYKIASQFFSNAKTIQRSNTLNGFTIFALRQALESGAKELLGIKAIHRSDRRSDRGNTQLPWKFLVEHAQKTYFSLPFRPLEMQIIYQWSNHFVHTGNDANCYVTAKALATVSKLFQRMQIQNFYGQQDWAYANIITDQRAMRTDIENFLAELHVPRYPEWAHPSLSHITG